MQTKQIRLSALPAPAADLLKGKQRTDITIGRSGAQVTRWQGGNDVFYLKTFRNTAYLEREYNALVWLWGRLPVPEVLYYSSGILITRSLPGEMSCSPYNMHRPERTATALTEALCMLRQVDITGCPLPVLKEAEGYGGATVLLHGDLCMPNVFLKEGRVVGFLDLGDCGIGPADFDTDTLKESLRYNFGRDEGNRLGMRVDELLSDMNGR